MTDDIGRADYVLGVDKTGVTKGVAEAEKEITDSGKRTETAYAQSGQRAGEAWGRASGAAIKVVTTAAATAFGLAAKGAVDLQNAEASFRAETGATADEATRAGKAINGMFKGNVQGVAEIGAALTKVHTDLGLTGDSAEQITDRFLKFARVTGQDAAGSVVAFDDILDAWNLTAADAQGLMDKLVAAHQKYGGSVEENQRALASLAPQLKAFNLSIDDGIALLNLFASTGLDASKAQAALNQAVGKLPPGETLTAFLQRLTKIADDGQRARAAIEVFGAKAGPALANALRPGIDGLKDFALSQDDITNKVDDANAALDNTFGAQAQRKIHEFIGTLNDVGPALTGIASITSIAGALGVDELVRKLGPKVIEQFKRVGRAGADAFSDGLSSITEGAGATVLGNNIATRIENIFSPGTTAIGKAWRAAGDKAATVYLQALFLGDRIGAAASAAFDALPLSPAVKGAATAAGTKLGTLMGGAMVIAIPLAIGLALGQVLQAQIDGQKAEITEAVRKALADGTSEGLQAAATDIAARLRSARAAHLDSNFIAFLQEQLDTVDAAMLVRGRKTGDEIIRGVASGVDAGASHVNDAIRGITAGPTSIARARGKYIGSTFIQSFYDSVVEKQSVVGTALQAALDADKNTMDKAKETGYLIGVLLSDDVTRGVHDKRDNVRAAYAETVRLAMERLEKLAPNLGNVSKDSMDELNKALKSKNPEVRRQAAAIKDLIANGVKPTGIKTTGEQVPIDLATALRNGEGVVAGAAFGLGTVIARRVLAGIYAGFGYGAPGTPAPHPVNANGPGKAIGGAFQGVSLVGEAGPEIKYAAGLENVMSSVRSRDWLRDVMRPFSLMSEMALAGVGGGSAGPTSIGSIHVSLPYAFPNVKNVRDLTPADLDDLSLALGERVASKIMRRRFG